MLLVLLTYYFLINQVPEGLKKCSTFWLASALVEVEADQGTESCVPPKLGNALPLFINGQVH